MYYHRISEHRRLGSHHRRLPRLYDHPAPSPPSGCLSFSSYFMIKWATHDDVADVSLCGLNSFYPSLPPTFFPPIHVTLRHPEALGNGFSSISLLIRISTAFSFSNSIPIYTQSSSSLPMYYTSFLSLLGLSFRIHILRCSAALTVCLSPPS
jgi:hypothetical protein